jgi:murein hydrolase activator
VSATGLRRLLAIVPLATTGAVLATALGVVLPMSRLEAQANTQSAEQRLRQQQTELDKLRKERSDLENRMSQLQRSARTLAEEVANLEAQRRTTARLVDALDKQLETINEEVIKASSGLQRAEGELVSRRGALQRRMVEIYKRGSLYDVEAMLSAQSFAGLVARYKYLHELAVNDRNLVRRVEGLRDQIISQRLLLVRLQDDVSRNRQEKDREARRLAALENTRQRRRANVCSSWRATSRASPTPSPPSKRHGAAPRWRPMRDRRRRPPFAPPISASWIGRSMAPCCISSDEW